MRLRTVPCPHQGKDRERCWLCKAERNCRPLIRELGSFEAHLEAWTREIADVRVHGTTGEAPIERFQRAEATALKSAAGIPPFHAARELIRRVQADCAVEIDGNAYSVPWRLIGETVRATISDGIVRIYHASEEVAVI